MNVTAYSSSPARVGRCILHLTFFACVGGSSHAQNLGTRTTVVTTPGGKTTLIYRQAIQKAIAQQATLKTTAGAGNGVGYFVDALAGSDSNAGTAASPWKSLAKLTTVTLRAGEGMYLRCGSVWRESLELSQRQLVDGSKIDAYGADCTALNKPRISGADDFTGGWTKSGVVWSRPVPISAPKIAQLFVNGLPMRTAQWPNFGGVGREYAITAAGANSSNIQAQLSPADRAALSGKDVVGATAQIRTEPWLIEAVTVSALDAGTVKLRTPTIHAIDAGDGFVLQDKRWMLDAPGEFFHDTANGVIYLYPSDAAGQANLNGATVEATVRSIGLVVSGRSGLAVSNVAVGMTSQDGVVINHAPAAVLSGVTASYNASSGVRVNLTAAPAAPARGATIRNSRFVGNGNSGIDVGNAPNVDVLANTVTDTGMAQAAWANASIISGNGAVVDGNLVERSAFRGILFSGFGGSRVSNNSLSNYCLRLSDCAAVYTVASATSVTAAARVGMVQNSVVEGNRVMAAALNIEGTVGGDVLAGIYLDDLSRNVTVRRNVVTGMPIGIYVHNASNNLVEGNKAWLTTDVGLMANMDRSGADLLVGNVFRGNQLSPAASVTGAYPALPKIKSSKAIRFFHLAYGTASITSGNNTFSGNQIMTLSGEPGYVADVGSAGQSAWLDVAAWLALNPAELRPTAPAHYATHRVTLGAEVLTGGNFDQGLGAWTTYIAPNGAGGKSVTLDSANGCEQRCVNFTSGKFNDRLSSPHFRMAARTQYFISFTAVFSSATDITHPNIARPDTPYDSYVDDQGLKSPNTTLSGKAGDIIRYKAFFTASSSDEARINLRVSTPGVPVAFDSVSLRPVTGYTVSDFKDWGALVSAPTTASKIVSCADLGWAAGCAVIDADGISVPMPLNLNAGTTKFLLWSNSPWRD